VKYAKVTRSRRSKSGSGGTEKDDLNPFGLAIFTAIAPSTGLLLNSSKTLLEGIN
jgi:hypothetical protein